MIIWKWELELRRTQLIRMPKGSKILSVQTQNGKPFIWAAFDHENRDYYHRAEETRSIVTVATGENVPDTVSSSKFLGTYQINDGSEIYHVFEET